VLSHMPRVDRYFFLGVNAPGTVVRGCSRFANPKTERVSEDSSVETGNLTSTESSKLPKRAPKIVPFELRMHRNDAVIATLTNFAYAFFSDWSAVVFSILRVSKKGSNSAFAA
jgi:hypothetical protein